MEAVGLSRCSPAAVQTVGPTASLHLSIDLPSWGVVIRSAVLTNSANCVTCNGHASQQCSLRSILLLNMCLRTTFGQHTGYGSIQFFCFCHNNCCLAVNFFVIHLRHYFQCSVSTLMLRIYHL